MPSPFPGMDPYLEDPGLWPDVHHELISETRAFLGGCLRPHYSVRIEERVYLSDESDPGRSVIVPDVMVVPRHGRGAPLGGTGWVAIDEPLVVTSIFEEEIREARVEIVDREGRRVVTVIEFLSPTNKVPGARGQSSYQQKRLEVMGSPSHLVEVDLLRGGVGIDLREGYPPCDYLVHVSRVDRRPQGLLWPVRLPDRLPVIPVPLKPGDPDVPLDLQAVLSTAYDRAGYDLSVDYKGEPTPPLSAESRAWSAGLLQARGLRAG